MHKESFGNGLGAQSMVLMLYSCWEKIPARISITADTGWEKDRTWSNGRKSTARDYYEEVVVPLGVKYGIQCAFVRSVDKDKKPLPDLWDNVLKAAEGGTERGLHIPMFGSKGGRLRQSCTDKWKIRAINQYLRSLGATTARGAQGIHLGEASRRVKGKFLHMDGQWSVYQTVTNFNERQPDGTKVKKERVVKWLTHYYPLVDLGLNRRACQEIIVKEKIPYLLSSECDGCPHKDLTRWERTDEATMQKLAETEAKFKGQYFFTDRRIPLMDAIAMMKEQRAKDPERFQVEADFGCENAICGI